MFLDYILELHLQDCLDILEKHDLLGYYCINVDFMNLFEKYPDIGDKVLCHPIETLPLCRTDVVKAQQRILEYEEYKTQVAKLHNKTLKRNVHARFFGLPFCPELHRTVFPKNADMGCFLKVTGTVVRVTQTKMLEYHRNYVCAKCKYENFVKAEFEYRYVLKSPHKCGNTERRCKSTTFTPVNLVSRDHCKDYQEIKIQEQVNKLSIGTIPGSMWVVLEDDLVDSCKPGDDVNICGTVRRRWRPAVTNKKCEVDLVLQANYLEVCNAQRSEVIATAPDVKDCFDDFWAKFETCPMKGRDRVLSAVCPQEDGEWQLEAGALVLSDGGVCCIDEIGQLREHDRTSIHEAMEQQTISIAKAGIVCKLNTRCAVVAACNPKGNYDTQQPLSVNVSLGTPLLSRFDLIFILLDSKNKAWDKLVSSYILFGDSNAQTSKNQWGLEKLQTYIALVGPRSTKMTKQANIILQTYYMVQRQSQLRDPSRTTVRMLDSLVRLSQAHCRLMYRTTILPMDAIVAVSLVDLSMQDCTLRDTVDALHSTFPKHPDYNYLCTAKSLLSKLNLPQIWEEELLFYCKLLKIDRKSLESEIDHQSSQIFAKFDDVTDDNIALPLTIITSSYFKKDSKKPDDIAGEGSSKEKDNRQNGVNNKLAQTLKKHASKNMDDKVPTLEKTNRGKRKRKEVTVDTGGLVKPKKPKSKKVLSKNEVTNLLNAVPSAYDVFSDLGMEINSDGECLSDKSGRNEINEEKSISLFDKISEEENKNNGTAGKYQAELQENQDKENTIRNKKSCLNKTSDKLKLFQFTEKRDLSKFYEGTVNKVDETSIRRLDAKSKSAASGTSQKSIFETSDCNIDIDLELPAKVNNKVKKPTEIKQEVLENNTSQLSLFETSILDNQPNKLVITELKEKLKSKSVTSVSSSQISIFESSNCDIDLDI